MIQTESRDESRLLHSNIQDLQKSQAYKFVDLPFVEQWLQTVCVYKNQSMVACCLDTSLGLRLLLTTPDQSYEFQGVLIS